MKNAWCIVQYIHVYMYNTKMSMCVKFGVSRTKIPEAVGINVNKKR